MRAVRRRLEDHISPSPDCAGLELKACDMKPDCEYLFD